MLFTHNNNFHNSFRISYPWITKRSPSKPPLRNWCPRSLVRPKLSKHNLLYSHQRSEYNRRVHDLIPTNTIFVNQYMAHGAWAKSSINKNYGTIHLLHPRVIELDKSKFFSFPTHLQTDDSDEILFFSIQIKNPISSIDFIFPPRKLSSVLRFPPHTASQQFHYKSNRALLLKHPLVLCSSAFFELKF